MKNQKIRHLLSKGKTEEAIKALIDLTKDRKEIEIQNKAIVLANRFNEIKGKQIIGLTSDSLTEIVYSILRLLQEIESEKETSRSPDQKSIEYGNKENFFREIPTESPKSQNFWVSFLILMLAILGIFYGQKFAELNGIISKSYTQYIGDFPDNLDKIKTLIEEAEKSISISVDYAGHASFLNTRKFLDLKKSISDACNHQNIKIEFISYNETLENSYFEQFILAKYAPLRYDAIFPKLIEDRNMDDFFEINPDITSVDDVQKQISKYGNDLKYLILNDSPNKSMVREFFTENPLNIWIVDDKKAIFSFFNKIERESEEAFLTTDPKLVDVLESYFEYYRDSISVEINLDDIKRRVMSR